ncbi:MAG: alpha/beta hydrolase [Oscillospiraceae bacterium]|nr:alpha/beta hydrolase [Oscillospiraceae bacterium]
MINYNESFVKYDDGVLWTCESGSSEAAPVLLCSGGPGCCDYLEPIADMLESDYHVIRFEQRGCGRSTADNRYDLSTAVDDIERVRQHYGVKLWIVAGHSWGANLALAYSMTYTEHVKALVYIAGTGIHDNRHWNDEFHRNADEIGEQLPEMAFPFNVNVNDEGNRSLREFGRRPDFYARISKLCIPALFVMAENDIRPSWPAEQLANLMPNSQYVTIKNASHYIWLDDAEKLEAALLSYLQSL